MRAIPSALLALLALLLAGACGGTSISTAPATASTTAPPPATRSPAVDLPEDGVAVGSYTCYARPGNAVRPTLDVLDQGLYASQEQIGHFRYDPDTRRIEWEDGPLDARGAWVGEYLRRGVDDVAYHTVRVRDRVDASQPGNERDLQWCQLLEGEPALPAPVTPSAAAPQSLEVEVLLTGGPGEADMDLFVTERVTDRVQVPYRSEHLVPLGTLVVIDVVPVTGARPVGCVIRVEGGVAAESAPGPSARCEASIGE